MKKLDSKIKTKLLAYLRNMPGKECEDLLNYVFIIKDPDTGQCVDLKMHKAIVYKIQRRLDKQVIDLCGLQSKTALREYLERAYIKIYNFLQQKNITF